MNHKRRNWIIGAIGLIAILGVIYWVFQGSRNCCALPPTPLTPTTALESEAGNPTATALLQQTQTAQVTNTLGQTKTTTYPYDPTLYAQRRHQEALLQTGAGPTQYAIFYATETAVVATYQGTPLQTPIPYTADMSPTAILLPSTTPTLCPPSDVVCPGGNATLSPVQEIYVLMASAKAPEFGQLAQTVTAMAATTLPSPTASPTSTIHNSNCAFNWAHQDLPDIAQAVRPIFDQISSAKLTLLRVDAYGENCNLADGSVSYFAAMTTDFYLSAEVTDLNDADAIGQIITTSYNVLTTLNIKLPAQLGYLDILLTTGSQQKHFRTMLTTLKPAIAAGKQGKELLEAGGGLR